MKKNANRALSMLLTLVMIISMLPISAFAENDAPATGTDIAIENMDGKEEDAAKETASPSAPVELPGTGEDKEQDANYGGEDKTAESTPTPEPSKAPAKQAAPAVSFTVSFDANGHGEAPEAVSVREGETVPEPAAMEAEGYSFLGWFRDQEASVAWDFDKDTVNADMTLYAGWEGNTPAPTRSGMLRNGGTKAEIAPEGITFNIEVISQSGSDGDWRVGDKGKATATVTPENASKDVKWEAYPEDIVEIDKDGYFTIIKQHDHSGFMYGSIYVESRDGSVFDYQKNILRLVPAGSDYWSNAIEAVEISECPNADGMWREGNEGQASVRWKSGVTPRTVTWSASHSEAVDIEIDSDGKFRVTRMDSYAQQNFYITATFNVNGVDYSCRSNAIKVFKEEKNVTAVKLIKSPTKLSYVIGEMFDYTGLEVELTYHDGTTGTSVNGEGFHYQPGQDGDWWGPRNTPFQYGDNKVAITYTPYYGDSGTGTIIFNIQVSPPPTYPITLDANGGTVNGKPTDTATIGRDGKLTSSLPGAAAMAHPNDNMQFMGWYTEKSGGTAVDTSTVLGANATIYAQWKDNTPVTTHDVTYAIEGGSFAEGTETTEDVKDGENPVKVPTGMSPDDDHKNIGAWYQDDGTAPVDPASVSITGPTSFTYKFEPKPKHTISFYDGSTELTALTQTVIDGGYASQPDDPTKEGWVFKGWYADASFQTAFDFTQQAITGDTGVYARFLPIISVSAKNIMAAGGSQTAAVEPAGLGLTFTWESSDPTVADISITTGEIKANKPGTTTITATAAEDSEITASMELTVFAISAKAVMAAGDSQTAAVEPAGLGLTFTWKSSDTDVATIDENSGEIKANKPGTTTITATAAEDSEITASMELTVEAVEISLTASLPVGHEQTATTNLERLGIDFTWTSSDPSVASIEWSTGQLRARKPGTVSITVTARDNSEITASTQFTVDHAISLAPFMGVNTSQTASMEPSNWWNILWNWTSSDPTVASIDYYSGEIKALKPGTTTITATSLNIYGFEDSVELTVFTLFPKAIMAAGDSQTAAVEPTGLGLTFAWKSSDSTVASIDENSGEIKALEAGTTTITATATDGSGLTFSMSLTVFAIDAPAVMPVKDIQTAVVEPSNTGLPFVWSSTKPTVASIDDYSGEIKAQTPGTTTITATAMDGSGLTISTSLTVFAIDAPEVMPVGWSRTATIQPDNLGIDFTWESSDPSVASIDENSGEIEALKAGTTTIRATATDGSGLTTSMTIKVMVPEIKVHPFLGSGYYTPAHVIAGVENLVFTWESSDTDVATIDENSGVIRALGPGTTTITATAADGSGLSLSSPFTVIAIAAEDMFVGDKQKVIIAPSDTGLDFTWESSDPSVASIDPNTGEIEALKPGKATITVNPPDVLPGDLSALLKAQLKATINVANPKISIRNFDPIIPGQSQTAAISQSNLNIDFTWSSSDPSVASIDPDTGVIHAWKAGTTIITARAVHDSTLTASRPLTVLEPKIVANGSMTVGQSQTATVEPPNTGIAFTWSSDDPDVASIDENTGEIEALKAGTTTIRARATDGSGLALSMTLTVKAIEPQALWLSIDGQDVSLGSKLPGEPVSITRAEIDARAENSGVDLDANELRQLLLYDSAGSEPVYFVLTQEEFAFVMPDEETWLIANYFSKNDTEYEITVRGGTASQTRAKANSVITLTAGTPPEGMVFNRWRKVSGNGGFVNSSQMQEIAFFVVSGDAELEVVWKNAPSYTVGVQAEPTEGGTVTGGGTVTAGQSVTVEATANSGYSFEGWYLGTTLVSPAATYIYKPSGDVTLTAKFKENSATAKIKTKLFVQTGPTVVDPSESAAFVFIPLTEDDQPLPARTVKASQLTLPQQATLDLDEEYNAGVVELPASALSLGANTLSLSWAGDESYEGCSATVTFTVANKQSLRLVDYAATLGKPGEPYTISGRFLDGNNQPLADTEITIRTQQEPGSTSMLPWFVTTDADGRFSYTVSQNLMYIHEGDTLDVELIVHATDAYLRFEKTDTLSFVTAPQTYTVTFMDGSTELSALTQTVSEGGNASRPDPDPIKEGHSFKGWYADLGFGKTFDFTQEITADTTVYARFEPTAKVIYEIRINGFVSPVPGKAAKDCLHLSVPDGSHYTITKTGWFHEETNSWLSGETLFSEGKEYKCMAEITPENGYVVAEKSAVTFYANGQTDLVDLSYSWTRENLARMNLKAMKAETQHTVTFNIVNGTWEGGTAQKTVTLAENSTIQAGDVPKPQPASGYGVGAWDTDPVGQSVTGNASYTWSYFHYKVDYDTQGMGTAPAQTQSINSGSSANGSPDVEWYGSAAEAPMLSGDDLYRVYDAQGLIWFTDPDDDSSAVKPDTPIGADTTLYCKWVKGDKVVDAVSLSVFPKAGDPIPQNHWYPGGEWGELSAQFVRANGTDYEIGAVNWEPDGDTTFKQGKTYELRVQVSTGDMESSRTFLKGHATVQLDGSSAITNPEVCYALSVDGAASAEIDYVRPTESFVTIQYIVPAPSVSKPVNVTVTGKTASADYDGTEKSVSGFSFTAKDSDDGDVSGVTVTLKSAHADAASIAKTDAGDYDMGLKAEYFEITLPDGYTLGTVTVKDGKLTIAPADISTATVKIEDLPYNSSGVWPEPTVTWNGITLQEGSDYDVVCGQDVNVGDKTATITGKGNYTGKITAPFKVIPLDASDFMVIIEPESVEYNGKPWTFVAGLADLGQNKISVAVAKYFSSTPLQSPRDFTLSWSDSTDAGTVTVTATMQGNYTGSATGTFRIEPAKVTITGLSAQNKTYDGNNTATVTGEAKINGAVDGDKVSVKPGSAVFEDEFAGTGKTVTFSDYELEGEDAGSYTLEEQPDSVTADITPADQTPSITAAAALVKGGNTLDLATLVSGAQGDLSFSIESGTAATLESDGKTLKSGDFTGTVVINVSITEKDLGGDSTPEYGAYTGKEPITVTIVDKDDAGVTVTPDSVAMTYGDTYTINDYNVTTPGENGAWSFSPDTTGVISVDENGVVTALKVGTAQITVKYESDTTAGQATITVTVEPRTITEDDFTALPTVTKVYNASEQTQEVASSTLTKDVDYEIKYENNINAGTASYTITGKGNYGGTIKKDFTIEKAQARAYPEPVEYHGFYDGKPHALLESPGTAIGGKLQYKLQDEDDTKWSENIPEATDAGSYYVQYRVVGDKNHKDYTSGIVNAAIKKASIDATTITPPAARTLRYTGAEQELVTPGACPYGELRYCPKTDGTIEPDITKWTTSPPKATEVGTYTVRWVVYGDQNHNIYSATAPVTVEIGKGVLTLSLTIDGWTEGEAAKAPVLSGNSGSGAVSYEYKLKTADEADYSTTVPTAAGAYTVRATVVETANYLGGEATADFTISPAPQPTTKHTVTYIVVNGTWADGTNGPKTEEVEDGQSPTQIPTGMLPAENYEGGSWNPNPTGATITDTASFTYTFTAKQNPPGLVTVTFNPNGGSVTPTSGTTGTDGKLTSLPTPDTRTNHTFDGWFTAASGGTKVTTGTVFTENTTIYAHWTYTGGGGGGGITTQYTLTYNTNGGSTIAATKHNSGTTVNLTATPTREGFTFDGWYADAALTSKITSIKMDGNKTVYAGWKETGSVTPDHDCPSKHLKDVDVNAWYHEYVDYVVEKGLMQGVADDLFAPNVTTTRAMIVTILHRLEGKPASGGKASFDDVVAGSWYADAVAWAEENDIVNGYGGGKFGPNDLITREQFAAIMYRYANFKGYDTGKAADLTGYADASAISDWALAAMKWANAEGLITGRTTTTLVPKGDATRAEAAAILKRFIENVK